MKIKTELAEIYKKELEKAKNALFKARSPRELRAIQRRIEYLKKLLNQ